MNEIIIQDGSETIKGLGGFNSLNRTIHTSSFYAIRHPEKRHLYEVVKSRHGPKTNRLVRYPTLAKYIALHLSKTKKPVQS